MPGPELPRATLLPLSNSLKADLWDGIMELQSFEEGTNYATAAYRVELCRNGLMSLSDSERTPFFGGYPCFY